MLGVGFIPNRFKFFVYFFLSFIWTNQIFIFFYLNWNQSLLSVSFFEPTQILNIFFYLFTWTKLIFFFSLEPIQVTFLYWAELFLFCFLRLLPSFINKINFIFYRCFFYHYFLFILIIYSSYRTDYYTSTARLIYNLRNIYAVQFHFNLFAKMIGFLIS